MPTRPHDSEEKNPSVGHYQSGARGRSSEKSAEERLDNDWQRVVTSMKTLLASSDGFFLWRAGRAWGIERLLDPVEIVADLLTLCDRG
ncbi:MAG: hypothetical protein U0841_30985 [Chloroflexia bacterium]